MIRLRVYCFGAFMAVLDGQELTGFRSDKARALLVYLLLSGGQPIPRTVLQELFWEGYEAKSGRASLRMTLANLAKLLKPLNLLHITRKTVQFEQSREQRRESKYGVMSGPLTLLFNKRHLILSTYRLCRP